MTRPEEWELLPGDDRDHHAEVEDRGYEAVEDLSSWDDDYAEAAEGIDRVSIENLWHDTGAHHGELWLDESDGYWLDQRANRNPDHRTRKPVATDIPMLCACGWPLPIRWHWRTCEFGEPTYWRTEDGWGFCRCNGCLGRPRLPGRPPERCTQCQRDYDNSKRRERYKIVTRITREMVEKRPVFVA